MGFESLIPELLAPTARAAGVELTREAVFSVGGDGAVRIPGLAFVADASSLLFAEYLRPYEEAQLLLSRAENWYAAHGATKILFICEWNNHRSKVQTLSLASGDRGARFAAEERLRVAGDVAGLAKLLAKRARRTAAVMKHLRALILREGPLPFLLEIRIALCESDGQLMFYAHHPDALARVFGCRADDIKVVGLISSDTDQVSRYPGIQHRTIWAKVQRKYDFAVDMVWLLRALSLLPQEFAVARLATKSDFSRGITERGKPMYGISLLVSAEAAVGCARFAPSGEFDLNASLDQYLCNLKQLEPWASCWKKEALASLTARLKQTYLDSFEHHPAHDCELGLPFLNPNVGATAAPARSLLNSVLLWELPLGSSATLTSMSKGELEPCAGEDGGFSLRPVVRYGDVPAAGHWKLRTRLDLMRDSAGPGAPEAELDEYDFITSRQMFEPVTGALDQALLCLWFCYTARTLREYFGMRTDAARDFLRKLEAGDETGALAVLAAHVGQAVLDRTLRIPDEFAEVVILKQAKPGSLLSLGLAWAGAAYRASTVLTDFRFSGDAVRLLLRYQRGGRMEEARELLSRFLPKGWETAGLPPPSPALADATNSDPIVRDLSGPAYETDAFSYLGHSIIFSPRGLLAATLRIFEVRYDLFCGLETFVALTKFSANHVRELLRRGATGDKAGAVDVMVERLAVIGWKLARPFAEIELEQMYVARGALHVELELLRFDWEATIASAYDLLRAAEPTPAGQAAATINVFVASHEKRTWASQLQRFPDMRVPEHMPRAVRSTALPSSPEPPAAPMPHAAPATATAAVMPRARAPPLPRSGPRMRTGRTFARAAPPPRAAPSASPPSSPPPQPEPIPPAAEMPALMAVLTRGLSSLALGLVESPPAEAAAQPSTDAPEQPSSPAAAPPQPMPVAVPLPLLPLPSPPPPQLIQLRPLERVALGPVLSGLYDEAATRMVGLYRNSEAIQDIGDHAFSLALQHEAHEARETHAAEQPPSPAAAVPQPAPVAVPLPLPVLPLPVLPVPLPPLPSLLPPAAAAAPPAQLIQLRPLERVALGPVLSGLFESAAARMVDLHHDSEAIQVVGSHAFRLAVQHETRETREELDELDAALLSSNWSLDED